MSADGSPPSTPWYSPHITEDGSENSSAKPNECPASWSATVKRSYAPDLLPIENGMAEFSITSPLYVVPVQLNGEVLETTPGESGAAPTRMSPVRLSPCTAPRPPNAWEPSDTRPMSMLAFTAQVWNARRISRCQVAVVPVCESVLNRLLVPNGVDVPSPAKLRVRWLGSAQGMPQELGMLRSSSSSGPRRRGGCLIGATS